MKKHYKRYFTKNKSYSIKPLNNCPLNKKIFLCQSSMDSTFEKLQGLSSPLEESCPINTWTVFCLKRLSNLQKKVLFHSLKTELIGVDIVESFPSVKEKLQLDMKTQFPSQWSVLQLQLLHVKSKVWIYWNVKARNWSFFYCFIPLMSYMLEIFVFTFLNSVMDIVVKIVPYMCKCYESSACGTVERNRRKSV